MISSIKAQILKSGIFRLDQEYHPIGIMNLTEEHNLCKKEDDYTRHDTEVLFGLIGKLAEIVEAYSENPFYNKERRKEQTELWIQRDEKNFEQGLLQFLKSKSLSPEDSAHYSNFVKDYKKKIRERRKRPPYSFLSRPTPGRKVPWGKVFLEGCLIYEFRDYTKISSLEKILHYVAHLLSYCKIEKGTHAQVFERIKKRHQRHWDDDFLSQSFIGQREIVPGILSKN